MTPSRQKFFKQDKKVLTIKEKEETLHKNFKNPAIKKKKEKKASRRWKKILVMYISHKSLISRTCNEILKINNKKKKIYS